MIRLKNVPTALCLFATLSLSGFTHRPVDNEPVVKTAKEAYIYGLPIVLTDLTRIGGGRPNNTFNHSHAFPDHTFRLVVRPNNDTYYSSAFLDLGKEPVVLSIPDTKDRYAVVPLMDAWTNVFASFGKRTTGTRPQTYVVTGPKWQGTLPTGLPQVKSPTDLVWIIGRVQVNSPEDGKNFVSPIQERLKLTPLSQWEKPAASAPERAASPTYSVEESATVRALKKREINVVEALKRLTTEEYFTYLNELLVRNPGLAADKESLARFAQIGIKPGAKFGVAGFDQTIQNELKTLPATVLAPFANVRALLTDRPEGTPDATIGHYGTNYQKRAYVAYAGLGALGPEEAVYLGYNVDEAKQPLTGADQYLIHFEPGKLPPARAFWSITLYDKDGYLVKNPIRRYAIGDRNKLTFNADGSLDIYVQNATPGKEKETNWLPTPPDVFNLSVRIYWPTDDYLHKTGVWSKPPITKVTIPKP